MAWAGACGTNILARGLAFRLTSWGSPLNEEVGQASAWWRTVLGDFAYMPSSWIFVSCLSLVVVVSHGHSALLPPAPLPLRASLIPFLVIKNLLAISLTAPWHVVLPVSGDPELVFSFFFFLGKAVLLISLADPFLPMLAYGFPDPLGASMHWMLCSLSSRNMKFSKSLVQ